MSGVLKPTVADTAIKKCLDEDRSFYVIAGAGSGKTTSLVSALSHLRETRGRLLRRDSKRVVCITYTKRAVAVIESRLGWDDLYLVSTLHSFLWGEIKRFSAEIRKAFERDVLPAHIAKKKADDNGGKSQKALEARARVKELEGHLANLGSISGFNYGDSSYTDFETGEIGHDDLIDVAASVIAASPLLRKIMGQKYPFIFVDEAQDTHENVVTALNSLCAASGLPLVGYFGDPKQQIYDKRAGNFAGPPDSERIPKEENFRSAPQDVELLNAFRGDLKQFPAGENANLVGSVKIKLIQSPSPSGPRGRYTEDQTEAVSKKLDEAIASWGWSGRSDVKNLYLVRQMIARRLKFASLHQLFTGEYSSAKSQEQYENGEHYLLKPIVNTLYPLTRAARAKDSRAILDVLRQGSPFFDPKGKNSKRPLGEMLKQADKLSNELFEVWKSGSVLDLYRYARQNELCVISTKLAEALDRERHAEPFDERINGLKKGEWLSDAFLVMSLQEIGAFCEYVSQHTEFSTQHGVKGEEYKSVLVVFDDIGSAWNSYSFAKMLTPTTAGQPSERQLRLSENLAYVCFSRAEVELRIVLFSSDAVSARGELLTRGLFSPEQIEVLS